MGTEGTTQIMVGGHLVCIRGLKQALREIALEFSYDPDDVVKEMLLRKLSRKNYIPDNARDNYAKAFLREFRKFLGKPVKEEVPHGLQIKVLGPGCALCDKMEEGLMSVMAEHGLIGNIEHIRGIKEIGKYGVMGMPALIINGKVKSIGKVPLRAELIEWLRQAEKNNTRV